MKEVLEKHYKTRNISKIDSHIGGFQLISSGKNTEENFIFVIKLKRIYVTLCDTTVLINHICGLPLMIQLLLMVVGYVSAGYKVYLAFMGDIWLSRIGGKIRLRLHNLTFTKKLFAVPVYTIILHCILLSLAVHACNSTYSVTNDIFSLITKFEFDKNEREQGLQMIFAEFSSLLVFRPIEFTVADIYVISKTFMASVNLIFMF